MGKVKKEKNAKNYQEKKTEVDIGRKRKSIEKKKTTTDEGTRKYGYISPNSVISMAESAGFSGIQEDVAKNLAEDVTYRLRYIIQQCKKYMIHSKHKKLSSADINEVLKMCDIPSVYGYMSDKPLHNFIYIKEADVFILDEDVVDLPSFALNEASVKKKSTVFASGTWLRSEDTNKIKLEAKAKITETTNLNSNTQINNENLMKVSNKNVLPSDNLRTINENEDNETKIPTNLIKYYGVTCNTILGYTDLKLIFQDLSHNCKIIPIIPYLLNFITIGLNKLSSERQLKRLLQTIEALSRNKNIDFTPYFATVRVINAILMIVASEKKPVKISEDFQLKSYAGHVLSLVLSVWCCRDEQKQMIVKKMGKLLSDFSASPKVHYGAIALLTALGSEALSTGFWKIFKQYLKYLEELQLPSNYKTESDLAKLEEVILSAAVSLYRNPVDEMLLLEMDYYLNFYFGDAVCNIKSALVGSSIIPKSKGMKYSKPAEIKCSKTLKYMNTRYKPTAKKLSVENIFTLPKPRKRKNTRIIFKFAGAIPVPEVNLKRRRFNSQYSQFIAGKESEGHVVIAGKCPKVACSQINKPFFSFYCLYSVL